MNIRQLRQGSNALAFIVVILAILAMINILGSRVFLRADLTENKDYTISDSTKRALKSLDDLVNINVYLSKKLPPQLIRVQRQLKDLLAEYEIYARGQLNIRYIDPGDDDSPNINPQIQPVPVQVIERDARSVQNVFLSIEVRYAGDAEVIPSFIDEMGRLRSSLEYDLTAAILKVAREEKKSIGFLTGHEERDTRQECTRLRSLFEQQYGMTEVKDVNASDGPEAFEDLTTLIIAGPKTAVSDREKYEIDQFIMRGGRVLFLLDVMQENPQTMQGQPVSPALNDMLTHYGVKLNNTLVLDVANVSTQVQQRRGAFIISTPMDYPYWLRILRENFNQEHVTTSQLESLLLPYTASLEVSVPAEGDIKSSVLVRSTDQAWTTPPPYNLYPDRRMNRSLIPMNQKQFDLAVELSGKFKSFFAGKPIPPKEVEEGSEGEPVIEDEDRTTIEESMDTQIIVVGTSALILDNFIRYPGNATFVQNLVEWMTLGQDLIGIRSRTVTDRPLEELSNREKTFVKYSATFAMPILMILFGMVRFYLRRRAKRMFETYGRTQG